MNTETQKMDLGVSRLIIYYNVINSEYAKYGWCKQTNIGELVQKNTSLIAALEKYTEQEFSQKIKLIKKTQKETKRVNQQLINKRFQKGFG